MNKFLALFFIVFLFPTVLTGQSNDAELTSMTTSVSVNRGRLTTNQRLEIQINNRRGEKFTDVVIPFSPIVKVSNIEAFILDANGNQVKKLRRGEIKERRSVSGFSFYKDVKERYFTLRYHEYPYTLVYSYRQQSREFIYLTSWTPVLNIDIPTRHAVLEIEIPGTFDVNIHQRHTDLYYSNEASDKIIHRWEASYLNLIKSENYSPWLLQFLPSVAVVPLNFKFEKGGAQSDWVEFGNWQYSLLKDMSDLPVSEKLKINSLIAGVDCKLEKTKILYRYLQNTTRYVNISIETGGLKPYPASYVARNRYGDCKALTNYFKAVLEHVGISSYYTLIWAGDGRVRPINKEFPSSQFNHAILGVFLESDTIWLDCTSKGPFDYPGTFNQNRDALLIDKNNSHFLEIPALTKDGVKRDRFIRFSPTGNSLSNAWFSTIYRGKEFESLYMADRFMQRNHRDQYLRNEFLTNGFDIIRFELKEPDFDNHEIIFEQVAASNNNYLKAGNQMLIKILPFDIPTFASPENRTLPVRLEIPIYYSDVHDYKLPEGYQIVEDHLDFYFSDQAGYYRIVSKYDEGSLIVEKEFLINRGTYESENYLSLYDFINQVRKMEAERFLTFQKIQNALDE